MKEGNSKSKPFSTKNSYANNPPTCSLEHLVGEKHFIDTIVEKGKHPTLTSHINKMSIIYA